VLSTDAAGRITVEQWVAAEVLFADWARQVNPRQLARHAHDHWTCWIRMVRRLVRMIRR